MASKSEVTHSKRPHVKTERMQEFIRAQDESHSPTKRHKCPESFCNKVFTSVPGLKYHIKTHSATESLFECRKCHKVFKSANGLKYHRERTKCDDCVETSDTAETFQSTEESLYTNAQPQVIVPRQSSSILDILHGSASLKNTAIDAVTEQSLLCTEKLTDDLTDVSTPPAVTETHAGCTTQTFDKIKRRPGSLSPQGLISLTEPLAGTGLPTQGLDKLTELAIIATGPQSPLLQRPKPPWETEPSEMVVRSLQNMSEGCVHTRSQHLESIYQGSSRNNDLKSSFTRHLTSDNSLNIHDGSDPRVSSSSPLCVSPSKSDSLGTGNWSHAWPTAVWQCFIKGTKVKFLPSNNWQLVEDIAQREQLAQQALVDKQSQKLYAHNGLRVVKISEVNKKSGCSEMKIHFSPDIDGQPDISVICAKNHPFFVKDKGWSSKFPNETVRYYGIPCCELSVNDFCLPPSHPEATFSEDIFKSLEELDFTLEDTSAALALSNMKQHKKSMDISPPAGSVPVTLESSMMVKATGPMKSPQAGSVPVTFEPKFKTPTSEKVKRPMNAYMLFAKDYRAGYTKQYPKRDNRAISVVLGEEWKALSAERRHVYEEKAKLLADRQKQIYPDCWKRKKQA